jgi:hypothetical protein
MEDGLVLGVVFGAKYLVAHTALQQTPAMVYELFHCLNIVFIVLSCWRLAYWMLGERLSSPWQVVGVLDLDIFVESTIMTSRAILSALVVHKKAG